jgi:hypothetical protein
MQIKVKGSIEAALQRFGDMVSGSALRAAAGVKHHGEIASATIGDDSSAGIAVDENNRDVWLTITDVLSGLKEVARLFVPAGVLFRLPRKGDGAHLIRGRKMRAPGAALAIPDGGDGSSSVVPGWDDGSSLDDNNSGIFLPEGWHVESTSDRIRLVANSGGTKSIVELQTNGNIVITPAPGQTVQIAGNAHPLPLWDTFESDLRSVISDVLTALTTPCVNGAPLILAAPPSPAFTQITAFLVALAAHTYESQVAKNG